MCAHSVQKRVPVLREIPVLPQKIPNMCKRGRAHVCVHVAV